MANGKLTVEFSLFRQSFFSLPVFEEACIEQKAVDLLWRNLVDLLVEKNVIYSGGNPKKNREEALQYLYQVLPYLTIGDLLKVLTKNSYESFLSLQTEFVGRNAADERDRDSFYELFVFAPQGRKSISLCHYLRERGVLSDSFAIIGYDDGEVEELIETFTLRTGKSPAEKVSLEEIEDALDDEENYGMLYDSFD